MIATLLLLAAVSVPDVTAVVGPPAGPKMSGEALTNHAEQLADIIRCPVCQGSSVGDSPSEMARNMKQQVFELVAAGFDDEQIIRYFEASYGEFIRLEPKTEGLNWVVWLAPGIGLVLGLIVLGLRMRRGEALASDALPSADALPDDEALAAMVLVVRERVYGWPGGRSPRAQEGSS